jgi:hemerythrin-like metal-binding protein
MKRLELTEDLLTGISDIDNQHRALFEHGNLLIFPEEAGGEAHAARRSLVFLAGYINYHFAAEMEAMSRAGIDAKGHEHQHQQFKSEMLNILRLVGKNPVPGKNERLQLHFLMQDWFSNHIAYWDKKMAEALRIKLKEPALPPPSEVSSYSRMEGVKLDDVELVELEGWVNQTELAVRRRLKGR